MVLKGGENPGKKPGSGQLFRSPGSNVKYGDNVLAGTNFRFRLAPLAALAPALRL